MVLKVEGWSLGGGVGTHDSTGTGRIIGTGYSKLMTSFYFISRAKPRMSASNGGLKTIPESHEGNLVEVSSHSKAFKLSQPIKVMRLLDRKCS